MKAGVTQKACHKKGDDRKNDEGDNNDQPWCAQQDAVFTIG
jgi:hypothetical protein